VADRRAGRKLRAIHPVHAILIASTIPLFLGALLSDWAYASTYVVQWTHFASWLIAGGLVFAALALLWAVVELLSTGSRRDAGDWLYVGLVVATFGLGFINALVHAKDAWAAMPAGLILSVIVLVLAIAANWAAHAAATQEEFR
jgi:uncharacterized membrane protein